MYVDKNPSDPSEKKRQGRRSDNACWPRLTEVMDGLGASTRQVMTSLNGHPICHSHEDVDEWRARAVMSDGKTFMWP